MQLEPYTLQSADAIARWDELLPLLERLPTTLATPLSHVRDMVARKEAQVWCVGDPVTGLLVTKIENSLETRYGHLWVAAGEMWMVDSLKPIVENWFREMGCKHVLITGRRGWKRALPDYTEQAIILTKDL